MALVVGLLVVVALVVIFAVMVAVFGDVWLDSSNFVCSFLVHMLIIRNI